jgi:hypothetical protein
MEREVRVELHGSHYMSHYKSFVLVRASVPILVDGARRGLVSRGGLRRCLGQP